MLWAFLNENMTSESIQAFFQSVYLDERFDVFSYKSLASLLLVYSDTEYAFSSDELSWLNTASEAFVCRTNLGYDILCTEIACDSKDYYSTCAAIIKMCNQAFSQRILHLFRFHSSVSFGSKRDFENEIEGNFCVTQQFDLDSEELFNEFIGALSFYDIVELPWFVCMYSPQERDAPIIKDEYIRDVADLQIAMEELCSFYEIPCRNWIVRFPVEEASSACTEKYKDVKAVLANIAEIAKKSSYETLDQAITSEEYVTSIQAKYGYSGDSEKDTDNDNDSMLEFSKEAFEKADRMLEEMLGKV